MEAIHMLFQGVEFLTVIPATSPHYPTYQDNRMYSPSHFPISRCAYAASQPHVSPYST